MSKAKDKGRRFENEVAKLLCDNSIHSERIPLSGSFGGKYDCDVVIGTPEQPLMKIECKYRENISMQLWEWIEDNDLLAVRRNNQKPLFIMRQDLLIELLQSYLGKEDEDGIEQRTN